MLDINWNPNNRQLRVFSALLIAFGVALGAVVYLRIDRAAPALMLFSACAILGVCGLVQPRALRYVYIFWMAVVFPVGWTVSVFFMAITFYVVLTPIGLARRLIRRDPLKRRLSRDAETYWQERPATTDTDRYFRQF